MSAPPMARAVAVAASLGAQQYRDRACAGLVRPPRAGATPIWRAYARVAVGAAVAIVALILIMVFVDVAAIRAARQAPAWLVASFRFATDFGLAGWFLIPLGGALLADRAWSHRRR